ncbi:MAG: SDR family oxidoreductase [Firmicutes bacterium]|nr:SDR family oxidoreductase [Bacillota bacterium]
MATAVITGASSGIGEKIAELLAEKGYNLVLAARRADRLASFADRLAVKTEIVCADLSDAENCYALYDRVKDRDVEILVNNAGFGAFGEFSELDLERETKMINLNVAAVHILTKLFLKDFVKKNRGHILNVASAAGFMPGGPLLAAYYATKAYVLSLSRGINRELKHSGSRVRVSALCPGPVRTEFNIVAGGEFAAKGISVDKAAKAAVCGMLKGQEIIVPGGALKFGRFFAKILPDCLLLSFAYRFQKRKIDSRAENTE